MKIDEINQKISNFFKYFDKQEQDVYFAERKCLMKNKYEQNKTTTTRQRVLSVILAWSFKCL